MAQEHKWTPGPWPAKQTGDYKRWIIGDGLVEGPNGYEVAEVYSDDCDQEEAKANAHLIAAAPDLYEALEVMLRYGRSVNPEAKFPQAVKALAKARGDLPC